MEFLRWIDNRTLLACQCIVIVVFSGMMFGLRALYPGLRGITSVATGILCGAPATVLFTSVGKIPLPLAALAGGLFTFLSSLFLYSGVLQFCEAQRARAEIHGGLRLRQPTPGMISKLGVPLLAQACAIAFIALIYFSIGRHETAPCIAVITLTLALSRGLMARALYRNAGGRALMKLFAGSMAVFGLISGTNAVVAMLSSAQTDIMQRGTPQTVTLLFSVIFFCVQGVFYLLMFAGDVTENVHEQARLDHLSGTLNRRGIEDALCAEMERRRRAGGVFSVLLIDVDHFKMINDKYGHAAGDESLRTVAKSINASVRAYDQLGRFGGDEFLLLLPQTGGEEAASTAQRIRDEVRGMPDESGGMPVTVSIGVTCCSAPEEMAEILSRADAALYEAKREGRDRVRMRAPGTRRLDAVGVPAAVMQGFAEAALPGGAGTVSAN